MWKTCCMTNTALGSSHLSYPSAQASQNSFFRTPTLSWPFTSIPPVSCLSYVAWFLFLHHYVSFWLETIPLYSPLYAQLYLVCSPPPKSVGNIARGFLGLLALFIKRNEKKKFFKAVSSVSSNPLPAPSHLRPERKRDLTTVAWPSVWSAAQCHFRVTLGLTWEQYEHYRAEWRAAQGQEGNRNPLWSPQQSQC